jgi:hypothetical protein
MRASLLVLLVLLSGYLLLPAPQLQADCGVENTCRVIGLLTLAPLYV